MVSHSCYVVMKQRQSVAFYWEAEPDCVFTTKKEADKYAEIKNVKAVSNHYWVSRVKLMAEQALKEKNS